MSAIGACTWLSRMLRPGAVPSGATAARAASRRCETAAAVSMAARAPDRAPPRVWSGRARPDGGMATIQPRRGKPDAKPVSERVSYGSLWRWRASPCARIRPAAINARRRLRAVVSGRADYRPESPRSVARSDSDSPSGEYGHESGCDAPSPCGRSVRLLQEVMDQCLPPRVTGMG
jgi:hypothetical protein